ncbi:MAG TPA: hypothetical protein VNW97_01635 [Candidatus Saccharimonadales bacterium]|jgi:hypothetical protein|nr:hypothetical protein [Candidatus Saccharimonadales bacterium]
MKKLIMIAIAAAIMIVPSMASAQTASGTLTVTATVNGSISLVFNSDAAGVALTGSGTNAATLAFGNVSAFGAVGAGVVRTTAAASFTVSSAVDVNVTKANSASANYTLKAQLGAADATNTWQVGGVTVTNAAAATVTATGAYATNNNFPVAITVPFATASGTVISNTINYTATAN